MGDSLGFSSLKMNQEFNLFCPNGMYEKTRGSFLEEIQNVGKDECRKLTQDVFHS
jgi:hypothetical protein